MNIANSIERVVVAAIAAAVVFKRVIANQPVIFRPGQDAAASLFGADPRWLH